MIYRILITLLSINLIAHTAYGATQDNTETPYFHFRKGVTGDDAMDARFKPIFFPKHMGPAFLLNSTDAEKLAFIQSLKEISHRSRAHAKDGFYYGLAVGGIIGTLAGAVIGTVVGYFTKTSKDNAITPDVRQQKKLHMLYKGIVGSVIGAVTGGLSMATFYTVVAADESIRLDSPSACNKYRLKEYCTLTHNHTYKQLIDFSATTSQLAAILTKARDGKILSDVEKEKLKVHTMHFTSVNRDQASHCFIETTSLANVVDEFNSTDKLQRACIPSIVSGAERAKRYANQNKWSTFFAASRSEHSLTRILNDFKEQELRENMQQTYNNISRLCPDKNSELPAAEQLSAYAAEIAKVWK